MIGIGLICVEYGGNDYYKRCTLNSIEYWSKKYPVVVFTNTPKVFDQKNCKVVEYKEKLFNFHDKISLLNILSKEFELAILVDANKLPWIDISFNEDDFQPGLHSPDRWLVDWKKLNELPKVNGVSYWKHWDDELKISDMLEIPLPICERILAVKQHEKFSEYVNLLEKKYKVVSTENDRLMKMIDENRRNRIDVAEGRAEGVSFALAAKEMGFPLFCPSLPLYRIKEDFKRQ